MAMSLALRDQYERRNTVSSIMLSITSLLVLVRFCVLAYYFDAGEHTSVLDLLEKVSSMYILPFTYMFLCDQCGTHWNNREAIFMSCLPILSLLSLTNAQDGETLRNGIVITQCITIGLCMVRLWNRIHKYGLELTKRIKIYYAWMACLLTLTILSFATNSYVSTSESLHWLFFIAFTLLIAAGYLLIPYSFSIHPKTAVQKEDTKVGITEEGDKNDAEEGRAGTEEAKPATEKEEDSTGRFDSQLIEAIHKLMEEDRYYLQPSINIDDVAQRLGTNRTYVTRLMRQEYGLSFIEYVSVARIQYSQKLLYTSPHATLEEVAFKSGFLSTSNYCRAFKRYTGTTPKGWLQTANR